MGNLKQLIGTATLVGSLTLGAAANAAVLKFTEGARTDIDGSVRVTADGTGGNDTAGAPPGFSLGTLTGGDEVNLHGRIVNIQDRYTFTSLASFSLEWIFEGYTIGGSLVDEDRSGFSGVPAPGVGDNTSTFQLTHLGLDGVLGGGDDFEVGSTEFTTDINSTTGDDQKLFAGKFAAGTYELFIFNDSDNKDALYDIRISAVPLPAGALLLLTGVAGFGVARRRKKAAAAA